MATQGRTDAGGDDDAERAVAAALGEASFVHVVAHADGDSLAAAGLLASAAAADDTPYQVSAARTADVADRRLAESDEAATRLRVGFGGASEATTLPDARTASHAASTVVRALGRDPDPALALAGVVAGDGSADGDLLERALDAGHDYRPGVAVPTENLADGLAHSTLVHADFSGDREAAGALLAELDLPVDLDAAAHRRVASLVAVDAAGASGGSKDALVRALRPLAPGGPFATVGGYGDVLDAVARAEPGLGVALALGHDVTAAALDAWRDHASAVHEAVRTADVARHSGVVVVSGGPVWTVARLVRDFRSPEPAALAVADGEATLATRDPGAKAAVERAASTVGGTAGTTTADTRAYASFDPSEEAAFVDAVREAL